MIRLLLIGAIFCTLHSTRANESANIDPTLGPPFVARPRAELGRADAPVVLIEFTDFRCAHCRQFHERVFPKIKERFVETGRVRFVAVHLALESGEQFAQPLAAAWSARTQGGYWAMREQLFARSRELPHVIYERLAVRAGLDGPRLVAEMKSAATQASLAADRREATVVGVGTTPYFLIRTRTRDGRWIEARVDGYENWPFFEKTINQALTHE